MEFTEPGEKKKSVTRRDFGDIQLEADGAHKLGLQTLF